MDQLTNTFHSAAQAVRFIEYDSSFSDGEMQQAKVLKTTCNLNDAACKLKLKDYKQAEKLCTKVSLYFVLYDNYCVILLPVSCADI